VRVIKDILNSASGQQGFRMMDQRDALRVSLYVKASDVGITAVPIRVLRRATNAYTRESLNILGMYIESARVVPPPFAYDHVLIVSCFPTDRNPGVKIAHSNDVDQSNRFDADQIGAKRRKALSV